MDSERREIAELNPWLRLLRGAAPEVLLVRLLELEIATTTVADERPMGASFPIDLVQLSLQRWPPSPSTAARATTRSPAWS
jgi:hypothetical protein